MAYIGVDINYGSIASQTAVSAGSTTPIATLDYSVPTSQSILVFLDGVSQVPAVDFNVTSGTNLTFTSSVPSGVVVCVYFLGRSVDIGTPASGTVGISQLSASGTASSSTFLRGDNTFATPAGGQITDSTVFFENWNTISSNQTTNLSSSKNMFVMGSISVTGSAVWTISGTGNLNII